MIVLIHITIALLSLMQATYGLVKPSRKKLHVTFGLAVATVISGVFLVWQLRLPILQPCLSGLSYLSLIIAASMISRYRLAEQEAPHK